MNLERLAPEQNPRYAWSDIGNGNLFADFYQSVARYVPERKLWYVYSGKVWEPDTGNLRAMELCKKLADELAIYALSLPESPRRDEYRKFVERWQIRRYRETVLKDAASIYPAKLSDFDSNPYLFNCKNGTLDLCTRAFHEHDPSDMLATISGVKYDPDACSVLWEKTVSDVMQGDKDLAAYLQKALGYGLTGDTSEECFFLLYGPTTRNGKGTVMETYMKMLGGYGKAARFLNENSFEFKPQFKLFINTNHLPKANNVTIFSSGRVKVLPFNRHFDEDEQDKELKKKLGKELSGVLNATEKYQHDSDKLTRFYDEMLVADPEGEVRTETAYQEYREWCTRNGQYADAYPAFKQGMKGFAQIRRKRPKGAGKAVNPTAMFCGVQLRN